MTIKTYNFPTRIMIGEGAADLLAAQLQAKSIIRPQIVTDSGIAGLEMFTILMSKLQLAGLEPAVFSDFSGNPLESHVNAGVKHYKKNNCDLGYNNQNERD